MVWVCAGGVVCFFSTLRRLRSICGMTGVTGNWGVIGVCCGTTGCGLPFCLAMGDGLSVLLPGGVALCCFCL